MVKDVLTDGFIPTDIPWRFEAGTPDYIGAIALAESLRYLKQIGMETVEKHSRTLIDRLCDGLREDPDLTVYYPNAEHYGILSFNRKDMHCFDVGKYLDCCRIAVRSGTHCCHIGMRSLNVAGTVRVSVGIYNTEQEIDRLLECLKHLRGSK